MHFYNSISHKMNGLHSNPSILVYVVNFYSFRFQEFWHFPHGWNIINVSLRVEQRRISEPENFQYFGCNDDTKTWISPSQYISPLQKARRLEGAMKLHMIKCAHTMARHRASDRLYNQQKWNSIPFQWWEGERDDYNDEQGWHFADTLV